jgi:hypothetical protein
MSALGKITPSDFNDLLTYTVGEYTRRNTAVGNSTYNTSLGAWTNPTNPTYSSYTTTPATGGKISLEHISKIFTDLNNFPASGKAYAATQYDIIKTSSMSAAVTYIQTLMNQNIVK